MLIYKVIGALIGYLVANILGAVLGWFIGDAIGRHLAGSVYTPPGMRQQRQQVFLQTCFTLMGRLAKADGLITQPEITHTENFMQQLGMSADHRREAIALFKEGAKPDFDVQGQLREFLAVCGNSPNMKRLLVTYLLGVAMSDGELHENEQALLKQIAASLGFSAAAFEQLLNMVQGQSSFSGEREPDKNDLDKAYQALGVTAKDNDAHIKKAYRKLMSQYHPDKLIGQGVPEDMIKTATERSQEVQRAYQLIKKHRGL